MGPQRPMLHYFDLLWICRIVVSTTNPQHIEVMEFGLITALAFFPLCGKLIPQSKPRQCPHSSRCGSVLYKRCFLLHPARVNVGYCDERVCLSVRSHISRTTSPNFTKSSLHNTHGPWIVPSVTARRCLVYFRFADDAYVPIIGDANKLSPRGRSDDIPRRWQFDGGKIAADLRPSADGSAIHTSLVASGG